MKYRQYLPIKFGNMLVGFSFGIFGAHHISKELDPLTCYSLFIVLYAISILFWSGEKVIYKSENDQTNEEGKTKLIVAGLLGIILVCVIIVQSLFYFQNDTESMESSTHIPKSPLLNPNGNFTLYVSNQSFEIKQVDIQVYIDGDCVVNQKFDFRDAHNWRKFVLDLKDGNHQIQVNSTTGKAQLTQEFMVAGKHWAVVNYWDVPKNMADGKKLTIQPFSFDIQDGPIKFM